MLSRRGSGHGTRLADTCLIFYDAALLLFETCWPPVDGSGTSSRNLRQLLDTSFVQVFLPKRYFFKDCPPHSTTMFFVPPPSYQELTLPSHCIEDRAMDNQLCLRQELSLDDVLAVVFKDHGIPSSFGIPCT